MPLKVSLLDYTPNPETVIAVAAHQCVSNDDAAAFHMDLLKKHPKHSNKIIAKALGYGHTSILEHVSFSFAVSGVSRTFSHQLVRFRVGVSYSQQSQRYVKFGGTIPCVTPPSFEQHPDLLARYGDLLVDMAAFYSDAVAAGIPAEDARFIAPNATETALIVTVNARELLHIFSLRCCTHAQWEIRAWANETLRLVKPILPVAFASAGPPCITGACPEGSRSCGGVRG